MHDPTARTDSFTLDAWHAALKHTCMHHKRQVQVFRQLNLTTKNLFLDIFWCRHPVVTYRPISPSATTSDVLCSSRLSTSEHNPPQWVPAWDRVLMLVCQSMARSIVGLSKLTILWATTPTSFGQVELSFLFFSANSSTLRVWYQKSAWSSSSEFFFFLL